MASWLARSTPERALRVRVLAGDIVLCSWARHFTLTVPLSTQVYKWVPANLMLAGNPAINLRSYPPSLIFRRGEGGHDTFTCRIVC